MRDKNGLYYTFCDISQYIRDIFIIHTRKTSVAQKIKHCNFPGEIKALRAFQGVVDRKQFRKWFSK